MFSSPFGLRSVGLLHCEGYLGGGLALLALGLSKWQRVGEIDRLKGHPCGTHIIKVAQPFEVGQLVVKVRAMSQHVRLLISRKLMSGVRSEFRSQLTIELKE